MRSGCRPHRHPRPVPLPTSRRRAGHLVTWQGWIFFGGHRETGETYLQCIVREVHEEIGYFLHPEDLKFLALYERLEPIHGRIRGELFIAHGIPTAKLRITEGTLLVAERTSPTCSLNSRPQRWPPCKLFRRTTELRRFLPHLGDGTTTGPPPPTPGARPSNRVRGTLRISSQGFFFLAAQR
jgi:8-oxo-dGTP pyrophosphatase MutT (NUDIX family)